MIATDVAPAPDLPLPLSQSAAYAAALRSLGQPVWQAETGAAHVLVSRALGLAATIRGPVWHADATCDQRYATLTALRLRLVEAETAAPELGRAGFGRVISPATVVEWDLSGSPETRRQAHHGKWRNALLQGSATPMRIEEGWFPDCADHWLYAGARAHARAQNYRPVPYVFTRALVAAVSRDARLWAAYNGKTPLAGMLFVRHGPVATYHLGWTSPAGREARAHHVLLSRAADWLACHGTTRLDLGTIDTEAAPGLARFKLGTGAAPRLLGGSWVRLPGLASVLASRRADR